MKVRALHQIAGPASAKPLAFVPANTRRNLKKKLKRASNRCLEFTGQIVHGYGHLRVGYETHKAHRVAWVIAKGPLKRGELVLHSCDNGRCCDARHLFKGTPKSNFDDMMAKGRDGIRGDKNYQRRHPEKIRRGEQVACAKFNDRTIMRIRKLYATGKWSQNKLAARFGVWQNHISKIVRGDLWSHVGGPLAR